MGAGASAMGVSVDKRREMYEVYKDQYTISDLNALAAEEKQAWLEIRDERNTTETAVAGEQGSLLVDVSPGLPVHDAAEESRSDAATDAALAVTVSSSNERPSNAGNHDDCRIQPQRRATRLSYHLSPEGESSGYIGGGSPEDGGAGGAGGASVQGTDPAGVRKKGGGVAWRLGSHVPAELPAWRKVAEQVETERELCVGDVVKARDKEYNGMWFEGVLTAIHDEATFMVEVTGGDPDTPTEYLTVGGDDIKRVLPWFCIEVGDSVECQPEGDIVWFRGKVVHVVHSKALYDVRLEPCAQDAGPTAGAGADAGTDDDREERVKQEENEVVGEVAYGVPESRIRKISSGRSAAARRWRKVFHASLATGIGSTPAAAVPPASTDTPMAEE